MRKMLFLYDFECVKCNTVVERLVESDVRVQDCPECKGTMYRKISPVRSKLDGTDPGFPDAYDKWARVHEKAAKAEPNN